MKKEYSTLHSQQEKTRRMRELFYYGLLGYLKKNLLDILKKESCDFNTGNGYTIDLVYTKGECPCKDLRIYKDSKVIVRVHEVSKENNHYHHDEPFLNINDENIMTVRDFASQLPSLLNRSLKAKYDKEQYKADEKEALYEMLYRQPI